jgi:hypothetical protein
LSLNPFSDLHQIASQFNLEIQGDGSRDFN